MYHMPLFNLLPTRHVSFTFKIGSMNNAYFSVSFDVDGHHCERVRLKSEPSPLGAPSRLLLVLPPWQL